jgi:uncharacterized protein YgiB involved in biofilm formation
MKQCRECKLFKPPDQFYRRPNKGHSLTSRCKRCHNDYRNTNKRAATARNRTPVDLSGPKFCPGCNETKERGEFYAHPNTSDRLGTYCKDCHNAIHNARRELARDAERVGRFYAAKAEQRKQRIGQG